MTWPQALYDTRLNWIIDHDRIKASEWGKHERAIPSLIFVTVCRASSSHGHRRRNLGASFWKEKIKPDQQPEERPEPGGTMPDAIHSSVKDDTIGRVGRD